jgi:hypothetical protein
MAQSQHDATLLRRVWCLFPALLMRSSSARPAAIRALRSSLLSWARACPPCPPRRWPAPPCPGPGRGSGSGAGPPAFPGLLEVPCLRTCSLPLPDGSQTAPSESHYAAPERVRLRHQASGVLLYLTQLHERARFIHLRVLEGLRNERTRGVPGETSSDPPLLRSTCARAYCCESQGGAWPWAPDRT